MYALFPNEARAFLSKHRTADKVEFLYDRDSSMTKEEDYVDINQIRELIRAVEESGVGEITIKEAGSEITVRKPEVAMATGFAMTPAAVTPVSAPAPAAPASAPVSDRPASWVAVTSPMVGTYYAAPAPDEPPFVQVGDEVMAGSTLCIVEAMKLMNEIAADMMCVVREVCVENAQPVEFGQPLFYVEPVDSNPASQKAGE